MRQPGWHYRSRWQRADRSLRTDAEPAHQVPAGARHSAARRCWALSSCAQRPPAGLTLTRLWNHCHNTEPDLSPRRAPCPVRRGQVAAELRGVEIELYGPAAVQIGAFCVTSNPAIKAEQ